MWAGVSLLLPLKSPRGMLARLLSIFLGFAPLFLLLSIGYGHPILHVWFRVKFVLFSLLQTTSVSLHETFMQWNTMELKLCSSLKLWVLLILYELLGPDMKPYFLVHLQWCSSHGCWWSQLSVTLSCREDQPRHPNGKSWMPISCQSQLAWSPPGLQYLV